MSPKMPLLALSGMLSRIAVTAIHLSVSRYFRASAWPAIVEAADSVVAVGCLSAKAGSSSDAGHRRSFAERVFLRAAMVTCAGTIVLGGCGPGVDFSSSGSCEPGVTIELSDVELRYEDDRVFRVQAEFTAKIADRTGKAIPPRHRLEVRIEDANGNRRELGIPPTNGRVVHELAEPISPILTNVARSDDFELPFTRVHVKLRTWERPAGSPYYCDASASAGVHPGVSEATQAKIAENELLRDVSDQDARSRAEELRRDVFCTNVSRLAALNNQQPEPQPIDVERSLSLASIADPDRFARRDWDLLSDAYLDPSTELVTAPLGSLDQVRERLETMFAPERSERLSDALRSLQDRFTSQCRT